MFAETSRMEARTVATVIWKLKDKTDNITEVCSFMGRLDIYIYIYIFFFKKDFLDIANPK